MNTPLTTHQAQAEAAGVVQKRETKAARQAREVEEARAAHFTPGNVVRSYGGEFDLVISYAPTNREGRWSVVVRGVRMTGPSTFEPIPCERVRAHATEPTKRELKAGPVLRAAAGESATTAEAAAPLPPR